MRATVLPDLGGKIASLVALGSGFEVVAQPGRAYGRPGYGDSFAAYDASGLDDAFPCIDGGVDPVTGWTYPDHGEIWSARFGAVVRGGGVDLEYVSPHFPYRYRKRVSLDGHRLVLDYRIEATSDVPVPCLWAFHGLLTYDPDMRFTYPAGAAALVTYDSPWTGPAGVRRALVGEPDLHTVPPPTPPVAAKFYLAGPVTQGRCGVTYPGAGIGVDLEFDPVVLPYLGVWITAGGFRGDHNVALEPANGFYDAIPTARANGCLYTLTPGVPLEFRLAVAVRERAVVARKG